VILSHPTCAMQELIDLSKQDGVLQGDVDAGTFVDLG
jgi:hypothetical protein